MKATFIKEEHLPFITWSADPQKITQIHMFVKNNMSMTRQDFKEVFSEIRDYLDNQNIEYGLLMMADGNLVFTSQRVNFNGLMVKLATGINYNGVVKRAGGDIAVLNEYLERDRTK